jgi:chaperonin GroES
MDDSELAGVGIKLREYFDEDEASRKPWRDKSENYLKLATQVVERKTYPWPDAANVKYPLLTTAAMQFAARAYPALVPGPNLVNGLVVGMDGQGQKQQASMRVGRHMSYQLLYEMPGWEEDMDKLCIILPILGCLFKKTYYDPLKNQNVSDLVLPNDLVVDYYAKSLDEATRIHHVIYKTKNQIEERIRKGLYCDVDLPSPTDLAIEKKVQNEIQGTIEPKLSPATPYKLIECHCWWDFDEDGYDEPYIITFDYNSAKILRIVARYDQKSVEFDGKTVVSIKPIQYFTKFGFIPNPDGSIYDLGFGILLGGINETVNTLTNQLLDAGTINNLQSGFLGRGIRIRGGNSKFLPGEWKPVDFTGDDIKKHIFPLPTKEPSDVLFKLLETLVTSGKELASVAEIFVGKMPGQNTPATTTMATIEQGLKVFTAIYKRIYRALGKEYEKLFRLNSLYMDDKVFFTINEPQGPTGQEVYKQDYSKDVAVKPNADPNIVSSAQKLMKVQAIGALLQLRTINPVVYTRRYLEAIDEENIAEILVTQPPPDPEQQKVQADMMMKQQDAQTKQQLAQMKMQQDQQSAELDARIKMMEAQLKEREMQMKLFMQQRESQMKMQQSQQEHVQGLVQSDQQHQVSLQQQKEVGAAKVQQVKAQAAAKPKPKPTGAK